MLSPEIIEKLKEKREEHDRPVLEIPLYPPHELPERPRLDDDEEKTERKRIVVIDLI